ncbi:glycosyltransferase family 4 protein [Aestuariivivens sediminis]|uniref:glycosyltransferase family 4 protein n=1 Tax=Aestuariivivens sediminis TaxID=2913557 RepID=UPI001F587559|nr:glycosyltransferase family 4 protein [Aestuariivivens sediminis]
MKRTKRIKIGLVLIAVPGYSETFFRNKIHGLQANGIEVVLFVNDFKRDEDNLGCKVISAPDFSKGVLKTVITSLWLIVKALFIQPKKNYNYFWLERKDGISVKNCVKHIIRHQYVFSESLDWLHFGFGMLAIDRENVAKAIGAKMAVSFRGSDLYLSPLKHPGCYSRLFTKPVKYHVLSLSMQETLTAYGISKTMVWVIPPAIDVNFFNKTHGEDALPGLNFLTVARLHWKKGLEYTLEALALLKNKGLVFHYFIIGTGDQYERLVFAAHQLGLKDSVTFLGKLTPKEVRAYMAQSDIYLQYSIQEGFCNAVLEAQAMGNLCVVSDAEGLPENVLHNKTGWVVPKRQPQALADQIQDILALPDSKKEGIRNQAVNRVQTKFRLEHQERDFYDFYSELRVNG